jgi:uncharacterized protein with HEPN domain
MHDETVYLCHILDAITRIEEYLEGVGEDAFYEQYLIQDAVIRQLEIIGEAVRHVSEELRGKYPQIPWQDIAGTRDKLIHDYFGVDLEKVWLMVCEDIPALKVEVQKILRELGGH